MALLEVKDLDVRFAVRGGDLTALRGISFSLDKGERLGLVGESGAGKSVAAFSILNLIACFKLTIKQTTYRSIDIIGDGTRLNKNRWWCYGQSLFDNAGTGQTTFYP